jgi:hypothetical protein
MTHERAQQLAELTQRQAEQISQQIPYLQKPKHKRFIIA